KNGTADINIVVQLGRIQYNSGNINKAKNIFLEIIRLQPRNLNAHYSLGLIYEKEENYKDALREFEAVFLLNSDNKKVVEKIDKLKKLIEEKSKEPEPEPEPEPVVEWGSVEDEMEEE
ncbi:MAG: tetratricopeptide repeat protein, partial [Patescibacteria group bacterium]|nr:tetratricopeptide repeat protein [Patescibacteria group bacterium]